MTSVDQVSVVQQIYDAFARGDVPAVVAAFDPQIEWREAEGFLYADGNPYVGPQAVLEGVFGRLATDWENFTVTPQRFVQTGEGVLSTGRYSGTHRRTGRRVDAQFAHIWRLEDGRVRAFQQFTDTAQFSAAAE